jgi:hypothetical protein
MAHRPGKMHSNVDSFLRNPAYSVLVKMDHDWEEKLWDGYQADAYCRRILNELTKVHEEGERRKERIIAKNKNKFKKAANKAEELEKDKEKDDQENTKAMDKVVELEKDMENQEYEKAMDKAVENVD